MGAGCAVCERARERCVRGTRHALWLLAWVRAVGGSEFYRYGLPADPGEEKGWCMRARGDVAEWVVGNLVQNPDIEMARCGLNTLARVYTMKMHRTLPGWA